MQYMILGKTIFGGFSWAIFLDKTIFWVKQYIWAIDFLQSIYGPGGQASPSSASLAKCCTPPCLAASANISISINISMSNQHHLPCYLRFNGKMGEGSQHCKSNSGLPRKSKQFQPFQKSSEKDILLREYSVVHPLVLTRGSLRG